MVFIIYYIFIVNNYWLNKEEFTGVQISDTLINNRIWAFNKAAPNLRKIKTNDKAIIYVAGKGNHYFYANLIIRSDINEQSLFAANNFEDMINKYFPLKCGIELINVWNNPLYIKDIKEGLTFIKDKINYGLYFRQSTKIISETDYIYITSKAAHINNPNA